MFTQARLRQLCLASATLCVTHAISSVAYSQDARATGDAPLVEEITVTGSRLRQAEIDTPNPTVSIDAQSIQLSGTTSLAAYLTDQPALAGSLDSSRTSGSGDDAFIGSTGLNLLDLRNLGTERTLVLVDGRRHVAQLPESASVDVNTIPMDLIERVDIATGGVSAVYGADAVSGVVNFIMKKNFEGLAVRSQYGEGSGGKPANWHASVTAGMNFADGRGNIAGAVEHTREGRLQATDRSYLTRAGYRSLQRNPADVGDNPNVPDRIPLYNMRFYDSSREGAIDLDGDSTPDVRPNGAAYEIPLFIPPFYSQGGSGTYLADYIGDVLGKSENTVASAFAHFDLSDSATVFGELKFARGKSFSAAQPTFDYGIYLREDNPFLSTAVRSQIVPGIGEDLTGDPAVPDGVLVNRDNFDLGVRAENNTRDTLRTVLGVNGDLAASNLRYEVSYTYGQTEVDNRSINNRFNDRFFAALDAVVDPGSGRTVCRSNLDPSSLLAAYQGFGYGSYGPGELSFTPGANSGCVPLNILGEGVANPAAIRWVMTDSLATSKITQNVATGFVSGDVPGFELPAGPMGFVLGAEWRRETSESHPPAEDIAGLTFGNVIFPTKGDFSVKEAFTELRAPLLKNAPFAELLEVTGALRFSDYTTVGNTTTWNLGAKWAPVSDILFRGTLAQSVRAPNISELFSPQSQTFEFIDDPCDITERSNGSQYRAANCVALLNSLGVNPATFTDPNSSSIDGTQRGNATLSEETARSWTVGAVFRPQFARGLSVSVDLYDIKIEDAISTPESQVLADNCVDQPTLNNVFCAGLTRAPGTAAITEFRLQPENVAAFRTRGVDYSINYQLNPVDIGIAADIGTFRFVLAGNHLDKLTFIQTPGADVQDDRTTQYAPKWQNSLDLTWLRGPLLINYGFNYFSKTTRYTLNQLAGQPDIASRGDIYFNARKTHDVQVNYEIGDHVGLYAGINNLTNQRPDLIPNYPVSPVGRMVYMGAKVNFAGQ